MLKTWNYCRKKENLAWGDIHMTLLQYGNFFEESILLFSISSLAYYFCLRQKRIIFKSRVSPDKGAYFFCLGLTDAHRKLQDFMILQEDMGTWVSSYFHSCCNVGKWPKALFGWLTFSNPFSMILPQLLTTWKTEMRLYLGIKLKHCKNVSFLATWVLIPDKELQNQKIVSSTEWICWF